MYISKVRRFLSPPVFEDEDKTRVARLLHIILLIMLAGTIFAFITIPITVAAPVGRLVITACAIPLIVSMLLLLRRGQVRFTCALTSVGVWLILTLAAITAGGVRSIGFDGYIIVIIIASLLLGRRAGFGFAGLSAVAGLGMLFMERSDFLSPFSIIHTPATLWMFQSLFFFVATMLLYLATRSIDDALKRARHSEVQAKTAQVQLLDAIESLTDAFALYDPDDRLVLCNSKYREYYDLSADLLVPGTRFEDHIRVSAYRGQIADAIGREEAWVQERVKQHQNPQGGYLQQLSNRRWLQISERKTGEGGIVGVRTDITERVRAEEKLKKSEKRLIEAQHIAKMGDFTWNVETGEVTWSDALFDLLQYDKSEKVDYARVNAEIHYPDDLERVTQWLNDCIASGKAELTPNEYRVIRKDGKILFIRTVGVIAHQEEKSAKVFATVQDISERKQAEEALRASEERLHLLMEHAPFGIQVFDMDGTLVQVNKTWQKMWGVSAEQVVGRYNALEDPQIDVLGLRTFVERAFAGEAMQFQDIRYVPDQSGVPGRERWLRAYCYHVPNNAGQTQHLVLLNEDITERKQAEREALEAVSQFQAVYEALPDLFFRLDADGIFLDYKAGTSSALYAPPEVFLGKHIQEVLTPEVGERLEAARLQVMRTRKLVSVEYWLTVPAGKRCFEARFMPLLEDQIAAIVRDITKRKQAEEALRESEERFRLVFDQQFQFTAILSPEGRILEINNLALRIQGASHEDYIGKYFWQSPAWKDLPEWQKIIKTQIAQAASMEEPLLTEDIFQTSEGAIRYAEAAYTVIRDLENNVRFILVQASDITERKQAEEALKRSEKHFRSLIENALDIITILDHDGTIRYESPSVQRSFGYQPEHLVGQNVFDYVHPDDLPRLRGAFVDRSRIAGPGLPIQARFRHQDGSWRVLEAIGTNLLDDPDMGGIVVNSRDITERKQLEDQLRQAQKMEAIGQLTAGIAHDFNNLLTAINGFAALMQIELPPDDPHQDSLDKILRSGQRAADLVRQLLAFSRKQVIQPRVLNLNTIVLTMDKMLKRIIGENIQLEISLSPDLWQVKVDPTQLEQVIVNLAVNARDAMLEGGRLTIETTNVMLDDDYAAHHLETKPGEQVLLVVSDTGHGMSEEVKAHIFEPFFTTKEQGKGTGLGLATVYGIIKQNEGHIWFYSEPENGTTFKIYLPRAEEKISSSIHMEVEAKMLSGSETILLVEDDAEVRNLVRQVLQTQGYTLLEAGEGQEALRLAIDHAGPVHLLLTDVIMPGMNGKLLAEKLIRSRPGLKILFMSGYSENVIVHHGVLDPGAPLLQKPFSPTLLARKVRNVLDG